MEPICNIIYFVLFIIIFRFYTQILFSPKCFSYKLLSIVTQLYHITQVSNRHLGIVCNSVRSEPYFSAQFSFISMASSLFSSLPVISELVKE